jgi:hypothetical protein
MDRLPNTIRGLLTGAALLAVALWAASVLSSDASMGCVAAYVRTIWERERLDQDRAVLYQREEVVPGIVDQLIAGQLSLPEAAAALRDEEKSHPERLRLPAFKHFLHLPPEERYMRLLLLRVDIALHGDPRRGEVLKRLRKELESVTRAPASNRRQ